MKILLASEDIPAPILGGLGKHTVRLGNALIREGHEVSLLGRSDVNFDACRAEIGFDGKFIPGFSLTGTGWKEASLGTFLPYKRPAIAHRIARAILDKAKGHDVIHYHGHYPMLGRLVPANINFVQTRHDQGSECLTHMRFRNGSTCSSNNPVDCVGCALNSRSGLLRQSLTKWAVNQYRSQTAEAFFLHKTIFVSDFLRQAFLRNVPQARSDKLHVIHNFIDTQTLPVPQEGDPAHILFVGRIDAAKGVMALLDALREYDDWGYRIDLIGDGPDRAACEGRHAAPHIRFQGWKFQAEALTETAKAGRIVVPSILEEPCGTTILEGLALNKPVYALARGGTPELKRYERWPGQLHLFDEIAALARGLVLTDAPIPDKIDDKPFGADISTLLPEFMRVYAL